MSIKNKKNKLQNFTENGNEEKSSSHKNKEQGSSLVITLLVISILMGFVALALSRSIGENVISSNDDSEARAFNASQAGLEESTRDFATVFETKLNPSTSDVTTIKNSAVTGFSDKFTFTKALDQVTASTLVTIQSGAFQGLYSLRDEWQVKVKAKEINTDVEVELMRRFYNNRIPLFQFGAFYEDDLELNRPPLFTFGGKVHTNGNFFVTANNGNGIYFNSKVTAAGEIINDIWKTRTTLNAVDSNGSVYFPNASGAYQQLETGNASVKCTSGTGSTVLSLNDGRNYPYPNCTKNTNWSTYSAKFEGNLIAKTSKLNLPITRFGVNLIEMMRRGKNVGDKVSDGTTTPINVTAATQDDSVLSKERFANKSGIRISLADAKNRLPGCATTTGACGVQLDAACNNSTNNCNSSGNSTSIGYQPLSMTDGYKTTAVNGNRLYSGKQTWIKVETVYFDSDNGVPVTKDITQDFLSLGMTESLYTDSSLSSINNPSINNSSSSQKLTANGYDTTAGKIQDSRSIIKIQRFFMDGQNMPTGSNYITNKTISSVNYNFVGRVLWTVPASGSNRTPCQNAITTPDPATIASKCISAASNAFAVPMTDTSATSNSDETAHYKWLTFPSDTSRAMQIVPFPIEMYDSREGDRLDSAGTAGTVYRNGVMSLIDIDVANMRRFFNGDFDGKFPTTTPFAVSNSNVGLKSTDIYVNQGWVIYISDRRGDNDFNGIYKMEQVNPTSSAGLVDQDLNNNGVVDIEASTVTDREAPQLDQSVDSTLAAVTDHGYYRRGVRLINGITLPGIYNTATPANTKGFTVASENGVYVNGNYNVQSVTLTGTNAPALSTAYSPLDNANHIPAAVVGDSVTILSNAWTDSNSFVNPFVSTNRDASNTQVRFAMISGDSLTAPSALTDGNFDGLNGGLHNFLRFVESWGSGTTTQKRLNYTGSLINLYNSFNNNGRWKCCTTVYDPPIRDWTFDTSFNDPNRLPPGSPYVYYLALTGFQRINE